MDPVSRADFDARLESALALAPSPDEGLFGPDSVVWKVARHTTVYLPSTALGAFMDVAHPWIAQGVAEHSRLFSDIRGRLALTYSMLMQIVFGDLRSVRRVSRGLHSLHNRVEGTLPDRAGRFPGGSTYAANEEQALLWVHLVFFFTRARMYELTVAPLSPSERDQYVEESRRFAACFGIPEELQPAGFDDMMRLVEDAAATDVFAASEASVRIVRYLLRHIPAPVRPMFRGFLGEVVPEPMLAVLGLPARSRLGRVHFQVVRRTLWLFNRLSPPSIRYAGPYHEAVRRLDGRTRLPMAARLANRAITRRPTVLS